MVWYFADSIEAIVFNTSTRLFQSAVLFCLCCILQLCVESLVTSSGSVLAVHPACSRALRVRLLHCLPLQIYTPVLATFEEIHVTIGPCERSVGVAG